jgi:hypothetical protein
MKKLITIFLILAGGAIIALGQTDSLKTIDNEVERINSNPNLTIEEYDANEVYGRVFDGGGLIKIYLDDNSDIKKIEEEIGLSFGRVGTTIYFSKGKPIKIIDSEENFKLKSDQTSVDYSHLDRVFEATIYIFDWDLDRNQTMIKGKRILSEGTCGIFEYEKTIDTAKKLLEKK